MSRLDALMSENESSSDEDEVHKSLGGLKLGEPQGTNLSKSQYISGDKEQDEQDDDGNEDNHEAQEPASIKNQMVQSRITTTASIILTKLPPSTNNTISKITEQIEDKVTIRFQPIGSAPSIQQRQFKVSYSQPFSTIIKFITKKLQKKKTNPNQLIHCYVNNSFSPCPDEIIGQLYRHFGNNGELVISYCDIVAFG